MAARQTDFAKYISREIHLPTDRSASRAPIPDWHDAFGSSANHAGDRLSLYTRVSCDRSAGSAAQGS